MAVNPKQQEADCVCNKPHLAAGDGGNPTYAVARALAAPALTVPCGPSIPVHHAATASSKASKSSSSSEGSSSSGSGPTVSLPRGDVLLLGGDLAYPNPSRETFEQRLFVPFQDALPPPPHYHPGAAPVWVCAGCTGCDLV
jgi:hypothetical protein